MAELPYAIGFCRRNGLVLLSDGQHATMTAWLNEDGETVYETSPETPPEARYLGYVWEEHLWATDVALVRDLSLH